MADRYLITFDIAGGTKTDYEAVLDAVTSNYSAGNISSYIKLNSLTTTYAIKSNIAINQITSIFSNATNKSVHVIVVKVIDSDWSIETNDANTLKKHKFWY